MIIFGLLILIAAVVVGVGTWFNSVNTDSMDVAVFNYVIAGQTNQVVLMSMLVGALGMVGFFLVLGRASALAGRSRATRREMREYKREAVTTRKDRDRLARENRDLAQQSAISDEPRHLGPRRRWWQRFSNRTPSHA